MFTNNTKAALIIEDELELLELLAEEVRKTGMTVVIAKDAVDAKTRLKFQKFDLIITDIRLGRGNGLELLIELKKTHKLPTHVVIMSGLGVQAEQSALISKCLGEHLFLQKPFDISALNQFIKSAVLTS